MGCWVCKGQHWLKYCPTATEADRKAPEERTRAVRDRRAKKATAAPGAGHVQVNGLVIIAYCANSGSDWTYIPRDCMEELMALGSNSTWNHYRLLKQSLDLCIWLRSNVSSWKEAKQEFILGIDTLLSLWIEMNAELSQLEVHSDRFVILF